MAQSAKAITLIMEFMSNQDLDDNGLKCGYDFKISGVFPDKPKVLVTLDADTDFQSLTPAVSMTWAEFLNMTGDTIKAITLALEFKNSLDLDGNGAVYGADFKCTTLAPDILLQLEEDEAWVEPAYSMTWAEYLQNVGSSYQANILRQECITGVDLDGNGLIYGKTISGFKITATDPFKTQFLIDMEGSAYWEIPAVEYWWSEYLLTI